MLDPPEQFRTSTSGRSYPGGCGLFERGGVGVAQAQIDDQFRGDAPVILNEPRVIHPRQRAHRIAEELTSSRRLSSKKVLEWAGCWNTLFIRTGRFGDSGGLRALELDAAPRVVAEGIGLDVRELAAELQAVLAQQVGDTVLTIVKRIGSVLHGTAIPTAQQAITLTKILQSDSRKSTVSGDACVEGVALAIREDIGVEGDSLCRRAGGGSRVSPPRCRWC